MKGVDSAARFSAAAAKAAGYDVGARYINQTFTASELADYNANSLILLPIYEESGKPGNFADGQRQGANALRLLTALGIPQYGCAFTDDVSGASYPVVREWVRGIKSTFPNHIVYYGPADKGDQLVDEGLAGSVWIEGAWSYSPGYKPGVPPTARHACGVQYPGTVYVGGVACDANVFYSTPWVPGSTPTPTTPPEDDDMPYSQWSDDDKWALANDVAGLIVGHTLTDKAIPNPNLADVQTAQLAQFQALCQLVADATGKSLTWNEGKPVLG